MLNRFEETPLRNNLLPLEWQSQADLDELQQFLQLNWEQRSAFYDDGGITSRQQFLSFTGQRGIRTGRYVGTIVFKGKQLNIFPKMFKTEKDDHETQDLTLAQLMKNLVQWIDYCTKFDYPYISIKSELDDSNDLRDLFIALYIRYVKNALDRGLFYQYEDVTEESGIIKGKFDLQDYVCNKISSGAADKFLCTYSSFELDNRLNRIIKYTCKLLMNDVSKQNQKLLRHILIKLNDVADVRSKPSDCDTVRLSRLHGNYRIILSMSKMFLLNKTSSYDVNNSDSFCFLFPTSFLFEGFIGGFMQNVLSDKARVKLQASEISLVEDIVIEGQSHGKAFTMRHDILVEHAEKGLFILDTKYKEISRIKGNKDAVLSIRAEANQPDLYQMFTYAIKRNVRDIYLLYPMFRLEEDADSAIEMHVDFKMENESYKLRVHIIRLPFIFEDDIEPIKERLTATIQEIFK